jgi:Rrf2 family protein
MLSQTAEHALRAVLYLAKQPPDQPVPAEIIAEALGAPRNYLSKTLNVLVKHGILASLRGPSGGFHLSVPVADLTLARVAEVFDEPRRRDTCMMGGRPCRDDAPCHAHSWWKAVLEEARAPLRRTSVADLLEDHDTEAPWIRPGGAAP